MFWFMFNLIMCICSFICMVINGLRGDTNMMFMSGIVALMCFITFMWNNSDNNKPKYP